MIFEQRRLTIFKKSLQSGYKPLKNTFEKGKMGLAPSFDITGYQFAGHGKEDFNRPADTELTDSVRSLQLGIGSLDARTNFVALFPLLRLLISIHLVSQSQLSGDFQSEIADCVPRLAAPLAMVWRSHRALVQHSARAAGIAVEDGMERTAGGIVSAENTVIYRFVPHRTLNDTAT